MRESAHLGKTAIDVIAELSHAAGGELQWEKTPSSQEPPNAMSNLAKQIAVTQIRVLPLAHLQPRYGGHE